MTTMWRVAVSALLVGVCQTSAHGSQSAVGQRRSSRSAVVEAPSARSALVSLRGGQAGVAAEVAAGGKAAAPKKGAALTDGEDEALPTRLRLTVAAGEASDASLVEVHPDTLEALGLSGGDCVLVRGTKMRRTAAMVNGDAKLAVGEARLSAAAQNNVKLAEGGELMLETVSHPPSPSASRVPQPDHSRSGSPSSGPEPSPSPSPIVIPILTIAGRARGGRGAHAARGGAAAGAPLRGGPQGGPG